MKTEKATNLSNFLNTAITVFSKTIEKKENELPNYIRLKNSLTKESFEKMYKEFEQELEENIREYKNLKVANDYITTCLLSFRKWEGFGYGINNKIMKGGHEVEFLLKLNLSIDKYRTIIFKLIDELYMIPTEQVKSIYNRVIESINKENREEIKKTSTTNENKPAFDDRFDFDKMMKECSSVATDTLSKINFIHDRIFDFKQWQLMYDKEEAFKIKFSKHESDYIYTSEYYPKFEELCKLELQRLDKKLELEKKALTHKALENNPIIIQNGEIKSNYSWKSSGTDLLELVLALHKSESIQRKDGKTLTRKELTDYFQHLFGVEIKDVEGSLTKATNRKLNMTPFLDSLKTAFENYAEEKLEKQSRRQ